jgi:hypothetical protein
VVGEGLVDGLRIDHPDGLANPAQYRHLVAVPLRPGARFEPPGGWRPVVSGLYSR